MRATDEYHSWTIDQNSGPMNIPLFGAVPGA